MKIHISVVIPAYNCEKSITELYDRLNQTLNKITDEWEIIFIDDNSKQNDWEIIKNLKKIDDRIRGIKLSRNYGQHNAIFAGLEASSGDWIIVMDCDLQDTPEEIEKLYFEAQKGYDIILAKRHVRNDKYLKKIFSIVFYSLLEYLSETEQDYQIGNFGIYHRKVIDSIISMGDTTKFLPLMVQWVGFKKKKINVYHSHRKYGKTSYNFRSLMKLAINIILFSSDKPIKIIVKLGFTITAFSFFFIIISLIKYFEGKIIVPGWTSIILLICFFSGIIISSIGIIGLYVGRIFENSKNRPTYIIQEKI